MCFTHLQVSTSPYLKVKWRLNGMLHMDPWEQYLHTENTTEGTVLPVLNGLCISCGTPISFTTYGQNNIDFVLWHEVQLCKPGWPRDLPASSSLVVALYTWASRLSSTDQWCLAQFSLWFCSVLTKSKSSFPQIQISSFNCSVLSQFCLPWPFPVPGLPLAACSPGNTHFLGNIEMMVERFPSLRPTLQR